METLTVLVPHIHFNKDFCNFMTKFQISLPQRKGVLVSFLVETRPLPALNHISPVVSLLSMELYARRSMCTCVCEGWWGDHFNKERKEGLERSGKWSCSSLPSTLIFILGIYAFGRLKKTLTYYSFLLGWDIHITVLYAILLSNIFLISV